MYKFFEILKKYSLNRYLLRYIFLFKFLKVTFSRETQAFLNVSSETF